MVYLEYRIPKGTAITLPESYPELAAYVVAGNVQIDRDSVTHGVMAVARSGATVRLEADADSHALALMVVATINRTLAALLIAIVGAEYVLGWMPKGTHHRRKPVKPSEATAALGDRFRLLERTGVRINPLDRSFHFSRYMGVNYMMVLRKVAA
jgi:hypothetical protein